MYISRITAWMTRTVAMVMIFLLLGIRKGTHRNYVQHGILLDTRKTSWARGRPKLGQLSLSSVATSQFNGMGLGFVKCSCKADSRKWHHEQWLCRDPPLGTSAKNVLKNLRLSGLIIFSRRASIRKQSWRGHELRCTWLLDYWTRSGRMVGWWIGNDMKGSGRILIKLYILICLEGLSKTTKNLSQDGWWHGRDTNRAPNG
jgi:hypothetical protein